MLKTTVLICALATAPQDCTRDTAIDVLPSSTSAMCGGLGGQAQLASTALAPDASTYPRIICERDRNAEAR